MKGERIGGGIGEGVGGGEVVNNSGESKSPGELYASRNRRLGKVAMGERFEAEPTEIDYTCKRMICKLGKVRVEEVDKDYAEREDRQRGSSKWRFCDGPGNLDRERIELDSENGLRLNYVDGWEEAVLMQKGLEEKTIYKFGDDRDIGLFTDPDNFLRLSEGNMLLFNKVRHFRLLVYHCAKNSSGDYGIELLDFGADIRVAVESLELYSNGDVLATVEDKDENRKYYRMQFYEKKFGQKMEEFGKRAINKIKRVFGGMMVGGRGDETIYYKKAETGYWEPEQVIEGLGDTVHDMDTYEEGGDEVLAACGGGGMHYGVLNEKGKWEFSEEIPGFSDTERIMGVKFLSKNKALALGYGKSRVLKRNNQGDFEYKESIPELERVLFPKSAKLPDGSAIVIGDYRDRDTFYHCHEDIYGDLKVSPHRIDELWRIKPSKLTAVCATPKGDVLFGMNNGRMLHYKYEDGEFREVNTIKCRSRHYPPANPNSSSYKAGAIYDITVRPDGVAVLAGEGDIMWYYDTNRSAEVCPAGEIDGAVFGGQVNTIEMAADGDMFVGGNAGNLQCFGEYPIYPAEPAKKQNFFTRIFNRAKKS